MRLELPKEERPPLQLLVRLLPPPVMAVGGRLQQEHRAPGRLLAELLPPRGRVPQFRVLRPGLLPVHVPLRHAGLVKGRLVAELVALLVLPVPPPHLLGLLAPPVPVVPAVGVPPLRVAVLPLLLLGAHHPLRPPLEHLLEPPAWLLRLPPPVRPVLVLPRLPHVRPPRVLEHAPPAVLPPRQELPRRQLVRERLLRVRVHVLPLVLRSRLPPRPLPCLVCARERLREHRVPPVLLLRLPVAPVAQVAPHRDLVWPPVATPH